MNKVLILLLVILLGLTGYFGYHYYVDNNASNSTNICQDDELLARLIDKNVNPFSKFKFLKKRNMDCKVLLITEKETKSVEVCSALDASTNSVVMLVYTYVNDMYDRETAAKELKSMVELMVPYDYCPQYYDKMIDLVKLKKRFAL